MAQMTLRVRAKGTALVTNYEALDAGTKRYVGWKHEQQPSGEWAFVTSGEETVPYRAEYVMAVKDGDLEVADEATAKICGVAAAKAPKKGSE